MLLNVIMLGGRLFEPDAVVEKKECKTMSAMGTGNATEQ